MKKNYFFFITIAVFLLAACGSSAPVPVTNINEITGDWKSVRPGLAMRVLPDGTVLQELTLTRINAGEYEEFSVFLEEGLMIVSGLPHYCGEEIGTYKTQILPSGNLEIRVVEDECDHRVDHFQAKGVEINNVKEEWVRVE